MKLLKIFGIVAGIHVVALILIFANPGCSTSSKRATSAETMASTPAPVVTAPSFGNDYSAGSSGDYASTQINATETDSPITAAPLLFNPDAPAVANDGRYSPTRPNTPVAGALKAEPVADVVPVTTYTVVRGDSLWSIAKRNGLSVVELSTANNLRASATLQLGQKLIIPSSHLSTTTTAVATAPETAVETKPAATTSSKESITHVVKSGETLGGIARKYQVKVGDIATANNISDPAKIRPGQSLVIPGWSAPVAKTTPKPAETKPAPATNTPATNSPVQPVNNPVIFTPPPLDQPLDQGFVNEPGDAPVIQVEETSGSQGN